METNETKPKRKRQVHPDRIVLEAKSMEIVKTMAAQLDGVFNGIVTLTSKEIANFVLQNRNEPFSKAELAAIREKHYDDVRAATIAIEKLKAAKLAGEKLTLAEVLGKMQTPFVMEKRTREDSKPRRKKSEATPLTTEFAVTAGESKNALHGD
jgi:hypothetical protein